jgi:TldD protein
MLEPAGLRRGHLNDALGSINRRDVDAADLYFQISRQESWSMEDGRIKEGSFNLDQGVGVRAVCGEKTGFAYSDEILLPALIEAAGAARAISRQGQSREVRVHTGRPPMALYATTDPITSISDEQKTGLMRRIENATRKLDHRIEQVIVSISSNQDLILIAAADGTLAADIRPLVRMNVSVIVEQDGRREQGYSGGGARSDLNFFLDGDRPMEYAREATVRDSHARVS